MNIEWVIACRYVEVHDSLATIIGGGIDTYWLTELPSPLQVVLAVRALATAEELEAGETHRVRNVVRDPDGNQIGEMGGDLAIEGEAARPDFLVGITLPMVVQFEATQEGTFSIDVAIDDASRALPIHVVHGAPA